MGKTNTKKLVKSFANAMLFLLGVALVLVFVNFTGITLSDLLAVLKKVKIYYFLTILMLVLTVFLLMASKWSLIVSYITDVGSIKRGYFLYYTCLAAVTSSVYSNLFCNVGVKAASLKIKHRISILDGFYIAVVEHVISFLVVMILLVPSICFVVGVLSASVALLISVAFLLVTYWTFDKYSRFILKSILLFFTLFAKLLNKISVRVNMPSLSSANIGLIDVFSLKKLFAYSFLIYFVFLMQYYVVSVALDIGISLSSFLIIFPFAYFITVFGITPGNLGLSEFGWYACLSIIGIDKEHIAMFVLGQRFIYTMAMLIIYCFSAVLYFLPSFHKGSNKTKYMKGIIWNLTGRPSRY